MAETGATGVIQVKTLAEAKSILRYQLKRKKLPSGITWEVER